MHYTHSGGGNTVAKDPFKFWTVARYRVQTFFGGSVSLKNILFSSDMKGGELILLKQKAESQNQL